MNKKEEILHKFQEFNAYLHSINLEELRKTSTRQELNDLQKSIYDVSLRSVAYEIGQLTKEMKEEEFPELLGVHHYPILKEIDFLTEEQKIALDEFLVKHRVGNFVYSFWRAIPTDKVDRVTDWLEEKEVIEKNYAVLCPHCRQENISTFVNGEIKEKLEQALAAYKESYTDEVYEFLTEHLDEGCMECDEFGDFGQMEELHYKEEYKLKMARDKTLDKV